MNPIGASSIGLALAATRDDHTPPTVTVDYRHGEGHIAQYLLTPRQAELAAKFEADYQAGKAATLAFFGITS